MTPSTISILTPDTDVVDRPGPDLPDVTALELTEEPKLGSPASSDVDPLLVLTSQADRVKLRGRVQRG